MGDAATVHPRARFNVAAPGLVNIESFKKKCKENRDQFWLDAQATTALRRLAPTGSVARSFLFLASEKLE